MPREEHAGQEDPLTELRNRLEKGLARSPLSKSQLAARSARGRTTIQQAFGSDGPVPSAETVAAIAAALGMPDEELLLLQRKAADRADSLADRAAGRPKPVPHRLRAPFEAGCSIGNATVLQLAERRPFDDFLDALQIIGLRSREVEPLRQIRAQLEQTEGRAPDRSLLEACGEVVGEVISAVETRTPADEMRWFRLGQWLHGIALASASSWPANPGLEDERTRLSYLATSSRCRQDYAPTSKPSANADSRPLTKWRCSRKHSDSAVSSKRFSDTADIPGAWNSEQHTGMSSFLAPASC